MSEKWIKRIPVFILIIFGFIAIGVSIRNYLYNKALEGNTIKTIAYISDLISGKAVHQTARIDYRYTVKGKVYDDFDNKTTEHLKIGDSILIEYAEDDPSISRIVDKYYMDKYKHLK